MSLALLPTETAAPASVTPAFDDIYRDYGAAVWRWARRLLGPAAVAEVDDLFQEVFLAVHQQLPSFREDSAIATWLYRIAANRAADRRRKRQVRRWFASRGPAEQGLAGAPDDALAQAQAEATVYRVLDTLDETSRSLIIWFELEGMSGAEVARLLNIKPSAIWVRLHRARAAFRERWVAMEARDDG
ncbi:MAG TPA: sigma-70 family RNA polymerase sigma factor [Myxococcales bacterium]|nr:sigma-70 family RNA polymerase sigma factor [Myxococcales bacterium]